MPVWLSSNALPASTAKEAKLAIRGGIIVVGDPIRSGESQERACS
jgi:hypothetical protein